jgi:hypothetical protein
MAGAAVGGARRRPPGRRGAAGRAPGPGRRPRHLVAVGRGVAGPARRPHQRSRARRGHARHRSRRRARRRPSRGTPARTPAGGVGAWFACGRAAGRCRRPTTPAGRRTKAGARTAGSLSRGPPRRRPPRRARRSALRRGLARGAHLQRHPTVAPRRGAVACAGAPCPLCRDRARRRPIAVRGAALGVSRRGARPPAGGVGPERCLRPGHGDAVLGISPSGPSLPGVARRAVPVRRPHPMGTLGRAGRRHGGCRAVGPRARPPGVHSPGLGVGRYRRLARRPVPRGLPRFPALRRRLRRHRRAGRPALSAGSPPAVRRHRRRASGRGPGARPGVRRHAPGFARGQPPGGAGRRMADDVGHGRGPPRGNRGRPDGDGPPPPDRSHAGVAGGRVPMVGWAPAGGPRRAAPCGAGDVRGLGGRGPSAASLVGRDRSGGLPGGDGGGPV